MKKHIHVSECDSTQDILKEQLTAHPTGAQFLVSCDTQLKGRGRGENTWTVMPGSLCFSFNLRPHPELSYTALEVSVLIARFFEARGIHLKLKWPNDLWDHSGKKCGGILIQGSGQNMLAGVGLNLFSNDANFGSIFSSDQPFNKRQIAQELADFILHHRYKEVDSLRTDWNSRCGHLNKQVKVFEGDSEVTGKFIGLGVHGECLLESTDQIHRLYNGSLRLIH